MKRARARGFAMGFTPSQIPSWLKSKLRARKRSGQRSPAPDLGRKFRYDPEVVARPHSVHRFVEDALAGGNIKRRSVVAAAHHDVVDPAAQLQRPVVSASHQRIAGRKRVTGILGAY